METMRCVFVEFIQKAPENVSKDDDFLSVKCDTVAHAIEVEALFHGAGWVARVMVLESVRHFPTAGMRKPPNARLTGAQQHEVNDE